MSSLKAKCNLILENNKIVAFIWFGLVAVALLGAVQGNTFNNFLIFKQSFFI